jgi:hypothetical protein
MTGIVVFLLGALSPSRLFGLQTPALCLQPYPPSKRMTAYSYAVASNRQLLSGSSG